jgi:hypothetical protein
VRPGSPSFRLPSFVCHPSSDLRFYGLYLGLKLQLVLFGLLQSLESMPQLMIAQFGLALDRAHHSEYKEESVSSRTTNAFPCSRHQCGMRVHTDFHLLHSGNVGLESVLLSLISRLPLLWRWGHTAGRHSTTCGQRWKSRVDGPITSLHFHTTDDLWQQRERGPDPCLQGCTREHHRMRQLNQPILQP